MFLLRMQKVTKNEWDSNILFFYRHKKTSSWKFYVNWNTLQGVFKSVLPDDFGEIKGFELKNKRIVDFFKNK